MSLQIKTDFPISSLDLANDVPVCSEEASGLSNSPCQRTSTPLHFQSEEEETSDTSYEEFRCRLSTPSYYADVEDLTVSTIDSESDEESDEEAEPWYHNDPPPLHGPYNPWNYQVYYVPVMYGAWFVQYLPVVVFNPWNYQLYFYYVHPTPSNRAWYMYEPPPPPPSPPQQVDATHQSNYNDNSCNCRRCCSFCNAVNLSSSSPH